MASPQVQDAVVRRIKITGEAVKNLHPAWRAAHPAIPWRQIAAMRDVLIHGYFRVDLAMTWKTVQEDVSPLAIAISKILDTLPET